MKKTRRAKKFERTARRSSIVQEAIKLRADKIRLTQPIYDDPAFLGLLADSVLEGFKGDFMTPEDRDFLMIMIGWYGRSMS